MEIKITRNKFGEFGGEPIFENKKVIFPVLSKTNTFSVKEGEVWEIEFGKIIPLNKVDKKGQPMFKGYFVVLNKVYTSPKSLAGALFGGGNSIKFFDKESKVFNLRCGDYIEQFPAQLVSRRFQPTEVGEIWERLEYEPKTANGYVDSPNGEIINKYLPPLFEGIPNDTPQEVLQKALANYEVISQKENKIKQKYENRNNYINNVLFPKEYKVLLAQGDYEIIKLSEGDPLSPLNGHEYDVFRIGGCKFIPYIKFIDEDYLELGNPPFSVDGNKDTIWGVMDYLTAPDFVGGNHKFFYKLFGIEEPDFNGVLQARFLYSKTIKSRFAYETLHSQGDETTHYTDYDVAIKEALDFEVPEDIKGKEIVLENELFIVRYIPTIVRGLFEESNFEEGVGVKDATWYSGSNIFGGVFMYYQTDIKLKVEACQRFVDEVKRGFTARTELPMFVRLIDELN